MPVERTGASTMVAHYLRRLSLPDVLIFIATLSLAVWLKLVLIGSGPADLAWLLSPTMHLVRAFTGLQFHFDAARGYINSDALVIVGTSCAGVNYLVIALCMTVFSFVPRFGRNKLPAFAGLLLAAYAVTVMVNSFRIIGGIALLRAAGKFNFIMSGAVHEAEGIFVYFSFLMLYYAALLALINRRGDTGTWGRGDTRGRDAETDRQTEAVAR